MAERRFFPLGVRPRITLIAVLVVGAVLAAATAGLLTLTSRSIERSVKEGALARAESLAAVAAAGAITDPLPGRDPDLIAQIVDSSGTVVASDRAISGIPPVVDLTPGVGLQVRTVLDDILEGFEDEEAGLEDEGPYAIVVQGVDLGDGPGVVIVASSLEVADQARNAVDPLLGIGLPIVLIIVGFVVWLLTGLALRPVESMRAEAGRISALALDRRLPLPEAQDEIRRLAGTLNEMLDRLERSALKRTRFVSDASHELKSPLAAMRTMVEVAAADGTRASDDEVFADLQIEINRMQALVSDLLFLARHDEHVPPRRHEEVDLDHVALNAARSAPAEIQIDTSGVGPVRIIGDPDALDQLARNLVENAARHAATRVWIETAESNGDATLTISDDGPGVPKGEADRIFERFVRLDESRARDTGGTGLGLSVARAIARDHGGDVVLAEGRVSGATFVARFPRQVD